MHLGSFPEKYTVSPGRVKENLGGVIWLVVRDWPQEKGYSGFTETLPKPVPLPWWA